MAAHHMANAPPLVLLRPGCLFEEQCGDLPACDLSPLAAPKRCAFQRNGSVRSISVQFRVVGMSTTGNHEHFVRLVCAAQRRLLSDDGSIMNIKTTHAKTRDGYVWPPTHKKLLIRVIHVDKLCVQKLLKLHGIRANESGASGSPPTAQIQQNQRSREFTLAEPGKVWVGYVSYVATDEGQGS